MTKQGIGLFYGVGVGPGDPELITRKAERILRAVDWIFLPAGGRSGSSFVRRIVGPLGLPEGKFRPISLCMSRGQAEDRNAYTHAALEILAELRRGKSVAWLTEGDPLFYSTFLHLYNALCRYPEVRVEIVPGVTSASAAAARAAVPVAQLGERVAVLPAAYGLERLPALLDEFATVFLLKVHSSIDKLLAALACVRGPLRAVYLEQVGTTAERVVTDLESLRGQELSYFSLVILRKEVGAACRAAPGEEQE
jgi:precorrin-2/cobalt-factor-2 C20-methyltransferase